MRWQVASLIVRCHPTDRPSVEATLAAVPGVEIAGSAADVLIVLVEGEHERELADRFEAVRSHPKVLSAVLVEHRIDTDDVPLDSSCEIPS